MYDEVLVKQADCPVFCVLLLGIVRLLTTYREDFLKYMLVPLSVHPSDPDFVRAYAELLSWCLPSDLTFAEFEQFLHATFEQEDAIRMMINLFIMTRYQKGRTPSQRQWWIQAYEEMLVKGAGPQDVIRLCECGKRSHRLRDKHTTECKKRLRLGIAQLKLLLTRHHLDHDLDRLVCAARIALPPKRRRASPAPAQPNRSVKSR